ncbi:MAG: hypothetical protein GKS05_02490 [Nitrospirales bacterium]|nr:hypothetical protein [Nitrospirales bacterium]
MIAETAYLIFTLRHTHYAIEANTVREIVWLPALTPIPSLPTHFAGMLNYRGDLIPVINLAKRLGYPSGTFHLNDRVVIFVWNTLTVGVIVNEVKDVRGIAESEISVVPLEEVGVDAQLRFVKHMAKVDQELLMIINPATVIHDVEMMAPSTEEPLKETEALSWPTVTHEEQVVLQERAVALQQQPDHEDVSGCLPFAVVQLNESYLAVDLSYIREFTEARHMVPVPCCPAFVVGNMNLRGDILTLIDVRTTLNFTLHGGHLPTKVMVITCGQLLVGILINDVLESIHVSHTALQPLPLATSVENERYLSGTFPYRGGLASILNVPKLLTSGAMMVNEQE